MLIFKMDERIVLDVARNECFIIYHTPSIISEIYEKFYENQFNNLQLLFIIKCYDIFHH